MREEREEEDEEGKVKYMSKKNEKRIRQNHFNRFLRTYVSLQPDWGLCLGKLEKEVPLKTILERLLFYIFGYGRSEWIVCN